MRLGHVDLVVHPAEFRDPIASLDHHLAGDGEDDAEEVRDVEALARQAEDALLGDHGLDDLEVVVEAGREPGVVDPDHHVHGTARHDRPEARHLGQPLERELGVGLDRCEGVVVKCRGGVFQDRGEGALDNGVSSDDALHNRGKVVKFDRLS